MNLNLNKNQYDKIHRAHKKNIGVTIQLTNNQIGTGKNKFNLHEQQITQLKNSKKNNTGTRLEIKHEQTGGFLPLVIAGIGAASALAGGASAVYTAITDSKHKKRMEQEIIRHNKEMEKINSKTSQGSGLKKKKKTKK